MSSPQFREALRRHPHLAELASLARSGGGGWTFFQASIHGVECLYGVRVGLVVSETITVRAVDDVTVARLRTDDYLAARRVAVPQVLWEYTGTMIDAIGELRALPHPEHSAAPKLLRPASSMFARGGR
ncbi:hypothetical protein FKR81_08670 [Lentzea tibetensis]|uniref:Uncharacterized protein n=1 Tax=Lentzea tibetensis TaxID=2591470 RepID=A0A563EXG6_9PSEU|nr:hypothetical protein [Lentzea tibetensis]TWP52400.1 hypothetical protein FKR81_08670 [Lentzea tibetensis]